MKSVYETATPGLTHGTTAYYRDIGMWKSCTSRIVRPYRVIYLFIYFIQKNCIFLDCSTAHSAHGTRASWRRPEEGSGAVYCIFVRGEISSLMYGGKVKK